MAPVGQAIAAFLDMRTEQTVRTMWALLANAGLPSLATQPGRPHPPHISLVGTATFDDTDWPALQAAAGPMPSNIRVHLDGLGIFATDEGALFLRVRPTADILNLHTRVHDAVASAGLPIDPYYRPDQWIPHCTLAIGATAAHHDAAARLLGIRTKLTARIIHVGIGTVNGAIRPLMTDTST